MTPGPRIDADPFDLSELGEAVAVVGMDGRFPGAADLEAFRANLFGGVESVTTFSEEELAAAGVAPELLADPAYVRAAGAVEAAELFDAAFFGLSPREAELLDPQHRLWLQCAWRALEDAGCDPGRFPGRVGVFAGAGLPSYLLEHVYPSARRSGFAAAYQAVLANDKDFLATRTAYLLGLTGPSLTVQTACSTSLVAVSLACQSLSSGECDAALAGGVSLRLPQVAGYLYQPDGILSPDGHCRAFDAEARGTVPGSGVGAVVLRRLEDAVADGDPVRAVIRGWAVNNDGGGKAGFTAPSPEGQAQVILDALAMAGVGPETVTYVEAHGTGTPLGDPIEVEALKQAFAGTPGEGFCALGSVKTNLGHLDAAAGVAGLIKTVLALEVGRLPPSLHFERPNSRLGLAGSPFRVCREEGPWETGGAPRRAGVSSFGIGGTNAHLVLEEAPTLDAVESVSLSNLSGSGGGRGTARTERNSTPEGGAQRLSTARSGTPSAVARVRPAGIPPALGPSETSETQGSGDSHHLMVISAKTSEALAVRSEALARHLEAHPELDAAAVAWTLRAGRRSLEHRRFVVAGDLAAAAQALRREAPTAGGAGRWEGGHRPVAFLFPGQGAQHPGMAAGLYRHRPAFRRELDRCLERLAPHLPPGTDLRRLLTEEPAAGDAGAAETLRRTELAQPALFAVSWALVKLWEEAGVEPEAMAGHSLGEWVAACRAGVFSLDDALALVALRGRLMAGMPPGSMLSVPLAEEEVRPLLGEELSLAAINAPALVTVSGPSSVVAALEERLAAEGRRRRRLAVSHAFHSAAAEPLVEPFRERVAAVGPRPPALPFVSSVTGTWITPEEAADPLYWALQLRRPVRFSAALAALLAEPRRALLEVGPGTTLATLARQHPQRREGPVASSLPHPTDPASDLEVFLTAAGRLWLAGVELEPAGLLPPGPRRKVRLPLYPFEGRRFWIEAGGSAAAGAAAEPAEPAPAAAQRKPDPADWLYAPTWKRIAPLPPAAGERGAEREREERPLWLLLTDEAGLGDELARRLAGRGETVVTAAAGTAFERRGGERFRLRPQAPEDFDELVSALPEGKPTTPHRVVLLWGVEGVGGPGSGGGGVPPDLAALLHLVQAYGRLLPGRAVTLALVSAGLYEVVGGEILAPERGAAAGLARVVPQEYPGIACRTLDVEPPPEGGGEATAEAVVLTARRLLAELDGAAMADGAAAAPVALRGRHRWQQVFEPLRPAAGVGSFAFEPGGHVLITGGLGRLGRVAARRLAERHGARLTLLDRRTVEQAGKEAAAALAACAEAGAEVEAVLADITDPAAVASSLAEAVGRRGPITGVIHAASAPTGRYTPISRLAAAELAAHLAPKLAGARAVDGALAAVAGESLRGPRFRLAASSLAPLLGGVGLAAFAAADAALEGHAHAAAAGDEGSGGGSRWLTLDWEGWGPFSEADEAPPPGLPGSALVLTPEEVLDSLERALPLASGPAGRPQVVVSTADLPARLAQWAEAVRGGAREAAVRAGSVSISPHRRETGVPYRAPEGPLEGRIAEVWQEVLGVERVGADDDFFLLGGSSLAGLQILSTLRAEMEVELPLQSFFEARTVTAMAAAVEAERGAGEADEARLEEILAAIEAMPDEEVTESLDEELEEGLEEEGRDP